MRPRLLRAVTAGVLVAGCSSPVCRSALEEQAGLCVTPEVVVTPEVTERPCEPACSAAAHEVCDGDVDSPSCRCAPGYEGAPCTWTGVLDDPGFQDQQAWTGTQGATVLPFEPAEKDAGFGFMRPRTACRAGTLSQFVEMPSYDVAEPLVAEVVYRARDAWGSAIGFNRAWTQLPPTPEDEWQTERVCLGEAAYGGPVLVQVGASEQHFSCFDDQPVGEIEVDHLAIVPAEAGECPSPGEALNGTAEIGQGGWQFDTTGVLEPGIVQGVGREGTSGVRLAREADDRVVGSTSLSVPTSESLPSPALRFWWRGTSGFPVTFEIGRFAGRDGQEQHLPLDDVEGNDSELSYVYCLPPWTHGNVVDLIFRPLGNETGGASEFVIDDIQIVSEARCGTSMDLLDPGFESGPPTRIMGVTAFTQNQTVGVVTNPVEALNGDGVLEFAYFIEDALTFWETWAFVPEANDDDGPALVFWSKVPAANRKPIRSVLGRAAVNPADLPVDGGWQRNEVCLPVDWVGRWYRFQIRLGDFPPIGTEAVEDPPIRVFIDDLELTTSSACQVE